MCNKKADNNENKDVKKKDGVEEMSTLTQRLQDNPFLSQYNKNFQNKYNYAPSIEEYTKFRESFKKVIEPINNETLLKVLKDK